MHEGLLFQRQFFFLKKKTLIEARNPHLIVEATETIHVIIQPHVTFPLYHSTCNSCANLQKRKFHKKLTSEKLQNSPRTVNYEKNIPITQASNSNNPPR